MIPLVVTSPSVPLHPSPTPKYPNPFERYAPASPIKSAPSTLLLFAVPQPLQIQPLPHSLKNNPGVYPPSLFGIDSQSSRSTNVVFSPRSSISRRLSRNDSLAFYPALTPPRRLGISRRRLLPDRP